MSTWAGLLEQSLTKFFLSTRSTVRFVISGKRPLLLFTPFRIVIQTTRISSAEGELEKMTRHIPEEADRLAIMIEEVNNRLRASEREKNQAMGRLERCAYFRGAYFLRY